MKVSTGIALFLTITLTSCVRAGTQQATVTPEPEAPKTEVRLCLIQSNTEGEELSEWKGPCTFTRESSTSESFNVSGASDDELLPGILSVSVYVLESGEAEVRGLTSEGINSRWGRALRDSVNTSCWKGSDFRLCAELKPTH